MWFEDGVSPGSGIMRLISGIEMLFAYIVFTIAFIALITKRRRYVTPVLLAIFLSCTLIIVVQAIAIPNIGTLYRMRLAPWNFALGLSAYASIKLFLSLYNRKKSIFEK
jgi:heme A synthase